MIDLSQLSDAKLREMSVGSDLDQRLAAGEELDRRKEQRRKPLIGGEWWARLAGIVTVIALAVAVVAVIVSVFIPEIRKKIGLAPEGASSRSVTANSPQPTTARMSTDIELKEHALVANGTTNPKTEPANTSQASNKGFLYVGPAMMGITVGKRGPEYAWTFQVQLSDSTAAAHNVKLMFSDDVAREEMGRKTEFTASDQNKLRLERTFDEIDVLDRNVLKPPSFMWTPPHIDHERYHATITWRDGSVSESLAVEKRFDNWLYAMTVKDNETGATLLDCKDKGFPYGPEKSMACFPEILHPQTLSHIDHPAN